MIALGNGRALPPLVFVTHSTRLAAKVGSAVAADIIASASAAPHSLIDLSEVDAATAPNAAPLFVGQRIAPQHLGVVLLGGYEVIPPRSVNVLSDALAAQLTTGSIANDGDGYVVWSDDAYGDRDGDGLPEIPVSRIPDGDSGDLMRTALQADWPGRDSRFGIRNAKRPYAEAVFEAVPGAGNLRVAQPTRAVDVVPAELKVGGVYLMLHGASSDGRYFSGEWNTGPQQALTVANVGPCPAVIFSGCCWGALSGDPRATVAAPDQAFTGRTAETSLALAFLQAGALAFIGCTGSHISPEKEPYDYAGEPLHRAFWARHASGEAPALALFNAKITYLSGIPHRYNDWNNQANELKILKEFTCLGLGW